MMPPPTPLTVPAKTVPQNPKPTSIPVWAPSAAKSARLRVSAA